MPVPGRDPAGLGLTGNRAHQYARIEQRPGRIASRSRCGPAHDSVRVRNSVSSASRQILASRATPLAIEPDKCPPTKSRRLPVRCECDLTCPEPWRWSQRISIDRASLFQAAAANFATTVGLDPCSQLGAEFVRRDFVARLLETLQQLKCQVRAIWLGQRKSRHRRMDFAKRSSPHFPTNRLKSAIVLD